MSGNGKLGYSDNAHFHIWKPQRYRCAVHDVVENIITSTVPGHSGVWCQLCWVEALDRMGVQRVVAVEDEQP